MWKESYNQEFLIFQDSPVISAVPDLGKILKTLNKTFPYNFLGVLSAGALSEKI